MQHKEWCRQQGAHMQSEHSHIIAQLQPGFLSSMVAIDKLITTTDLRFSHAMTAVAATHSSRVRTGLNAPVWTYAAAALTCKPYSKDHCQSEALTSP